MSNSNSDERRSSLFVEIMLALLRADFATVVAKLILPHLPGLLRRPQGMYEVLEHESQLELRDTSGKDALLTKHQKVLFLQDNIIAYQDQAWGDGDIFADYKCSPGIVADRYREGHKYRILISLRETKNRGDVVDFRIERAIKNGMTKAVEDFQVDIDHRTRKLVMSVIVPQQRTPKQIKVIEQQTQQSIELSMENIQSLPDGRWLVTWETEKPKLHGIYILRWEW